MNNVEKRLIFRVLDMYYNLGLSQEKISKKINVSRSTISRMLTKAKKNNFVSIKINYPNEILLELEKNFEDKFGLQESVIVKVESEKDAKMAVSEAAAEYLYRNIKDNTILSITWGRTLKGVVDCMQGNKSLENRKFKNVKVISVLGSLDTYSSQEDRMAFSNYLAQELGDILNAESFFIHAPMMVKNKIAKNILENEQQIARTINMAKKSDIAIGGIGSLEEDSSPLASGLITEQEQIQLKNKGVVGDISARYFNKNGEIVETGFDDRIIGISAGDLIKIPKRIGVAYGKGKVETILAALRGGLINVIITDSITADLVWKRNRL